MRADPRVLAHPNFSRMPRHFSLARIEASARKALPSTKYEELPRTGRRSAAHANARELLRARSGGSFRRLPVVTRHGVARSRSPRVIVHAIKDRSARPDRTCCAHLGRSLRTS
jgi:hypothetical protein